MIQLVENLFRSHDLVQEAGPDPEGMLYTRGRIQASDEYVASGCTMCPGCGEGLLKESPIREQAEGDDAMSRYCYCSSCGTIVVETLVVSHAEVILPEDQNLYREP